MNNQSQTKPGKCSCCNKDIQIPKDYQPKFDKTVNVDVINPLYCEECAYVLGMTDVCP